MSATHASPTANELFKARSGRWTGVGLVGAVAIHLAIFLVVQPFEIETLAATEEPEIRIVVPEVPLPAPPPEVPRPALPRIGGPEIDPSATIALTPFEDYPELPPAPAPTVTNDGPRFIAYDTPPSLRNEDEVGRALRDEYPRNLREAGFEGRVLLWLYVDEAGQVQRTEVKESSGSIVLDDAAVRVAEQMRFSPAKNRDVATAVWVQQWITFRVR